jgi:signal peptidase I
MAAEHSPSKREKLLETMLSFLAALFIFMVIRSSVIEAFRIPSGSMFPTLVIGDHVIVNKFAYGLKLPFSDWVSQHPTYLVKRAPPQRGDVIVFVYPKDESIYYIKRVIGVPGDLIEVRNKTLYLNQKPIERMPLPKEEANTILQALEDDKYTLDSVSLFKEKIGTGEHLILTEKNKYLGEDFPPTWVPADSLFVMGDNRDFSNDSRFWGMVPYAKVKGKALRIWLSLWRNPDESRWVWHPSRIGQHIQ